MMDAAVLASRLLGSAVIASGRPVAAAFAAQVVVAVAVHGGAAALPDGLAWAVSPLALGVGLLAAVVEFLVQHTEGADELLRGLHADKLLAALAGLPALVILTLLTSLTADVQAEAVERLVATGVPQERAERLVDDAARQMLAHDPSGGAPGAGIAAAETRDLAAAIRVLEDSQTGTATKGLLLATAFALQLAMLWIRGQARAFVEDLGLERVWAWLETGGIAVGVVLVVFAPVLMLAFALAFAALAFLGVWALRFAQTAMDALRRRPCPACASSIRVEASRCPRCKAEIAPTRLLGAHEAPAAAR